MVVLGGGGSVSYERGTPGVRIREPVLVVARRHRRIVVRTLFDFSQILIRFLGRLAYDIHHQAGRPAPMRDETCP